VFSLAVTAGHVPAATLNFGCCNRPKRPIELRTMHNDIDNAAVPGLWRRLAAIFYDIWLVAAIWLLGATADTFIRAALGADSTEYHLPLQLYLLISPAVFFSWFWIHGGQTLGMRSWRLKLLDKGGSRVTLGQSLVRYAAALLSLLPLGLGYLWVLFDRDGMAWHDRLSNTRLVMLKKD
jgi:uncharacterized RDD family membrane protein YckC